MRIFVIYRPARFFAAIALVRSARDVLVGVRFLIYYATGHGSGHIQSLILASILLIIGFQTFLVAFLADLMAANRKLLEDVRFMHKSRGEALSYFDHELKPPSRKSAS